MALDFSGYGLSITSTTSPLAPSVIQGGDLLNLTFRFIYNGTNDVLVSNTTACQELYNRTMFIKLVITLPVVFEIVYPKNMSGDNGTIFMDFLNCSLLSSMNINSSIYQSDSQQFNVMEFDIMLQNVISWASTLNVQLRLLHLAKAGSLLNISGNVIIANETKQFYMSSYTTPVPGNLQLTITSTSILETPNVTLTSEESVTFAATFQLPILTTTNLTLVITLPVFANSTPMTFIHSYVKSFSKGVSSHKLSVGSLPEFSLSDDHRFPHPDVAQFSFGETVNPANESSNGTITVEVTAKVDSNQGLYIPDSEGNVTCLLMYFSSQGINVIAGERFLALKLGQPLLETNFVLTQGCCYEGNTVAELKFQVKNPHVSTAAALNVIINITISWPHLQLQKLSVNLCENISFSNKSLYKLCLNLTETAGMLVNSSSGLTVNLPRLNSSSWVNGSVFSLVRPSVAANSFHANILTMAYTRTGWLPINKHYVQTLNIKPVRASVLNVISSNVPHPTQDSSVITIGEDIIFRMVLSVPVSTNHDFTLQVSGQDMEGVAGRIIGVGNNIQALDLGKLSGRNFNITGNSKTLRGNFGSIVNIGTSSQPSDSEIEYEVTIQAPNGEIITNGRVLEVTFDVTVNGMIRQPPHVQSLQVIEPDLRVTVTPSRFSEVEPNSAVAYLVRLEHSQESTSHAFRVDLEIAVPHDHFSDTQITEYPAGRSLEIVDGDQSPSGDARYRNRNTKVLLFKADDLLLGQTVSFKFQATTFSGLQASIYVSLPVHLAYATLPISLAPREGRNYTLNSNQGTFLTIRPPPFVSVTFEVLAGSFDAGDRVEYNLTLSNIAQSTTAYDLSVLATFEAIDGNRVYRTCSSGSVSFSNGTLESQLFISSVVPSNTISCNYVSFIKDRISPKKLVSQTVAVEYYSLSAVNRPLTAASYKERRFANVTTKPINTTAATSQNSGQLQAGDPVNFTFYLQLPECVTNLSVDFQLPTVPRNVIELFRRRRDAHSEEAKLWSRIKRSPGLVYVLTPFLDESYVKFGNGFTLMQRPNITFVNPVSLNVAFGLLENLPGSGPNDTVEIFLKFGTANNSLVLSGRPLYLTALLNFDAGSDSSSKKFKIIGPLLKPLLSINKTVKVLQDESDSPPVAFNITISHAIGSLYDARNLTVTDTAQGMDIYDSAVSTKGVVISYPGKKIFGVRFILPSLRIGETRSFIYVAHFRVEEKEPSPLRIPAEVVWKSVQFNSPTYRLRSDSSTACLQRNDVDEAEPRKVFGYFALGVLLGLLVGGLIAAIIVLVVVKCCDKGKMAPYYMRFTNTSTMTVLTGGSQYIYRGEELPDKNPVEKHSESSIVQTDESIVPILSLDNASQTEKELNSLDVQYTAAMDADLENQRQNMFVKAVKLLARKLRVKREISSEQERNFCLEIKQAIGAVAFKMSAEYKRKSIELRKKLQTEGKNCLDTLHRKQIKESEEMESKTKGLANEEKKEILGLLKKRHKAQEHELKQNLKLEQDVEMERLRKEVSISKRFALKEAQNKMIQKLIKDAKLDEEQANALIKSHLANVAAIDKATDEEKARRVVELEMKLAERKALARQKQEEEDRKRIDLKKLEEGHSDALESLVRSSTLSTDDAALYLKRFREELELVESKLAKGRKRQERKLHQKLTALKQRKIEEKVREHQRQAEEFEQQQAEKFEHVEIDMVAAVNEKQKLLVKHWQEIEETERNSDKEAAEELQNLRDHHNQEANHLMEQNSQKIYQELINKGLLESEKEAILERHMADVALQQEAREEERRRQRDLLERRLEKQRALLEKKMKEEQVEQAEVRKQEDKIVGDLIVNQVALSEEERDRIIREHEKNVADLESSLTLSKLRQRQLLEEKLARRRKAKMEQLEKRQIEETKDRDYDDKILAEGEDIEMMKKHEQEKMAAMTDDEVHIGDDMEAVREEMLAERSRKLQEHHEKLGAIITQLQIEKAKQMSKIAMQQEALGQLQAGLIDELEAKGTFQKPETQKIMDKYQKDTKALEENLQLQKDKQEKALRDRLQERMRQREETLVLQQKDEMSRYLSSMETSNTAMKLRKAAVKARHQNELNDLRNRMQKEIDQSINDLKMASDVRRMQAIESQNIKLISILIQQDKLQEEELQGVLTFLFPTKSSNEIDELLSKIYGPNHNRGHALIDPRRPSTLEARIRRQSSIHTTSSPIRKPSKKKRKSTKNEEEQAKDLPPITFKGGRKGFNLSESLCGYHSLKDEEQSEQRRKNDQRGLLNFNRKGSYQRLSGEKNVDGMFEDSPEKDRKTSGKKKRRRSKGNDEDVVS